MDYLKPYRVLEELLRTLHFPAQWRQLRLNLREPGFFPELPRKSLPARLADNLRWYLLHGEISPYYNSFGFDVKGLRDQRTYLPSRRFRLERNGEDMSLDSIYGCRYLCVLRDKLLFSAWMGRALGARFVPEDLGLLRADGAVSLREGLRDASGAPLPAALPLAAFLAAWRGDFFMKKLAGACGDGCCLVETAGEGALRVNGGEMTAEAFTAGLLGSEYVLQRRIRQHEALSRLNPSCVNTIRIVTILGRKSGEPRMLGQFLRLGVDSVMDNRATGGLAVRVDDEGVLRGDGFGHHFRCAAHPVTGAVFEGVRLPFWPEAVQLVLDAHNALRDIPSVGWDVAITPDGPVLVEGNDDYELCGIQDTAGGVREKWIRLHNM